MKKKMREYEELKKELKTTNDRDGESEENIY